MNRLVLGALAFFVIPLLLGTIAFALAFWTLRDSTTSSFWFTGAFLRASFLGLLVASIVGVIGGYVYKVMIPKYRGRPA